jgi:hypothetical protein
MVHFIETMSKTERKEYRDNLRDSLINTGGRIYTDKHSGVTAVIEPIISGNNCKFFRVATAYCNSNDKFRKSTGEAIALYRLLTDRCIVISCKTLDNTNERMDAIADSFIFLDC